MNPMQIVQMIKQGQNPQQLMLTFLENNFGNTPMGQNLIQLAKTNQTGEIEKIAKNIYAEQGKDYEKEFNAFRQMLGL